MSKEINSLTALLVDASTMLKRMHKAETQVQNVRDVIAAEKAFREMTNDETTEPLCDRILNALEKVNE